MKYKQKIYILSKKARLPPGCAYKFLAPKTANEGKCSAGVEARFPQPPNSDTAFSKINTSIYPFHSTCSSACRHHPSRLLIIPPLESVPIPLLPRAVHIRSKPPLLHDLSRNLAPSTLNTRPSTRRISNDSLGPGTTWLPVKERI
jgi:hypothetical protein